MNRGLDLWKRGIASIPGGNGLLSKRPGRYVPDTWPTYFSKAKGVEIWDLEGHRYIDMAQMGLGSAILGYSNEEVDNAVIEAIKSGINTTLNAPEEVELAERLLELNPFSSGVRFARTGGEAMAIAVRIARAYSGRDGIAFSGYHGWSDWYLAANLADRKNLDGHLLPGLSPNGVPRGLQGTAIPFSYNDISTLKSIVQNNSDLGAIVIEGARYDFPTKEFLEGIHEIAKEKNLVIISDEITSGWRLTDGGVYKINGFRPDMVVYGKALGNGFAIAAILGNRNVMDVVQDTFISSTFWTERVGFVAALETIKIITRERIWEQLISMGTMIGEGWSRLAKKYNLNLRVTDFKPLITMKLEYGELNQQLLTLFSQEMLKRGYLAGPSVYVSFAHNEDVIQEYLKSVDEVFSITKKAIETNTVMDKLESSVRDELFTRLNP